MLSKNSKNKSKKNDFEYLIISLTSLNYSETTYSISTYRTF